MSLPVRRRVLVATLDTLGERMAGPAIRAWELSSVLAERHDVRLVTFGECTRRSDRFVVERIAVEDFRACVDDADVLIVQGYIGVAFPWLRTADVLMVADMYDPFHIESLEVQREDALGVRDQALASALGEINLQLGRADVVLCASDRQRDLWIGHLAAAGRINPLTYDADPSLTDLVRIVPFGISAEPPVRTEPAIRGVIPGISADDRVVLWGGGVYNWFDPLTLVHAIDRLRADVPDVRLVFMGMAHPNPDVPRMRMAVRTRELADELGLTGRHVFFNEEWVPYERRADFLLDADLGVSCHFPSLETQFSFRTRMLDYLWAGLPIVATEGDAFARIIAERDLGRVVPAEDPDALAAALRAELTDQVALARHRDNVREVAREFVWPVVLQPVVDLCEGAEPAADAARVRVDRSPRPALSASPARDARRVWRTLRTRGIRGVVDAVRLRLARRKGTH
ncbi:glycosyltransferase family 4 protein [Cellulomonas soli]|uniref:glycosyltransferase family 4 protein n=1 Tax=Cellulomonas soli TaxID=931535 RepID=UPI003F874E18